MDLLVVNRFQKRYYQIWSDLTDALLSKSENRKYNLIINDFYEPKAKSLRKRREIAIQSMSRDRDKISAFIDHIYNYKGNLYWSKETGEVLILSKKLNEKQTGIII